MGVELEVNNNPTMYTCRLKNPKFYQVLRERSNRLKSNLLELQHKRADVDEYESDEKKSASVSDEEKSLILELRKTKKTYKDAYQQLKQLKVQLQVIYWME